jgi:hypothetical protein
MGYLTKFSIYFKCPESWMHEEAEFIKQCNAAGIEIPAYVSTSKLDDFYAFAENDKATSYGPLVPFVDDGIKWYEWEQEMRGISKRFPEVFFTVEGKGEEDDDIWVAYFLGGKMQKADGKIVFDPFDARKLE